MKNIDWVKKSYNNTNSKEEQSSHNEPHNLALRQGEDQAAELIEADVVVGALRIFANIGLNLLVRDDDSEVVEGFVEVFDLVEVEVSVVVDIEGIEKLTKLWLCNGETSDVVLELLTGEVAVVVVARDEGAAHISCCLFIC